MPEEASAGGNVLNCGTSSPISAAVADSTTNPLMKSPPIKCEATSTSVMGFQSGSSKCDIKSEPVVKIEKLFDVTDKLTFSTQMDSKQITDVVKYGFVKSNIKSIFKTNKKFCYTEPLVLKNHRHRVQY